MTTVIKIDRDDNWSEEDPDSVISKLNRLLGPHGVAVENIGDPSDRVVELRAFSLGPLKFN